MVGGSQTLAVNNSGYVVGLMDGSATGEMGTSGYNNTNHVWFYHLGDGTYTDLTATVGLAEPKTGGKTAGSSGPNLINSSGQVVGRINVSGVAHAALWNPATPGVITDLNTLYATDLADVVRGTQQLRRSSSTTRRQSTTRGRSPALQPSMGPPTRYSC